MELGNIIFGNSRGSFSIDRDGGFYDELVRLFHAYAPDRDNGWREYGVEFENDTFSVMPYYWGDCTCGFEEQEFPGAHQDCYQSAVRDAHKALGWPDHPYIKNYYERPEGMGYGEASEITDKIRKDLCEKMGLSYPSACAVHCTCDYAERYNAWAKEVGYETGHKDNCMLVKPNFEHKESGYQIQWYKYPLRDAYQSEELNLEQFRAIIDDCIKSITNDQT